MIVAVTVYASLWPILVNTIDGVRNIEPTLIDTARTFGLSRRLILWRIVLPAASPYIVTGLRISLSIALILVTTAEMIAGSRGTGLFYSGSRSALLTAAICTPGLSSWRSWATRSTGCFSCWKTTALRWRRGMIARESA